MSKAIDSRILVRKRNYYVVYMVNDALEEKVLWRQKDHEKALDAQRWFGQAVQWFASSCLKEGGNQPEISSFIRVRKTPTRFGVYMYNEYETEKVMWYANAEVIATTHAKWFREAVKEYVRGK